MTRLLAYMTTPGGLTGAPRRLLTLASALKSHGIDTCIASRSGSEFLQVANAEGHETAVVEALGVLGLRQRALFSGGLWFRLRVAVDLLRQNYKLFRCICKMQSDVVWVRGSKGIAFGAIGALLSRRPLVWDVDYELPSKGVIRWLHLFGLWASLYVVFQYAAAPNKIFGEKLASQYQNKFRAIIPGIDLASLKPFRDMRAQQKKPEDSPFVILQVGTICDRKNQMEIIEALRLAINRDVLFSCELWLAYDDVQDLQFLERLHEYGLEENVSLLGWREDVKDLMTQADVLVMPSRDEGVPNAVQEAMAIGLPVLVSKAGGMPEIVQEGVTGWVMGIDDPGAWAEKILYCQKKPVLCEQVGRNAADYAFKNFGTDHWGREYARVLKEAIALPASRGHR
ncbi:glycosyltransferase family 4 protein [Halomonas sp. NO4]|uniref:glycosyltransferase family 4 protein n=1 Tax=Halomonas sp. NO4 TaxID=2484813 RepID=UPI00196A19CF|nr:glycosyltransferase family 4 protein [Halomonas sp. NO4]